MLPQSPLGTWWNPEILGAYGFSRTLAVEGGTTCCWYPRKRRKNRSLQQEKHVRSFRFYRFTKIKPSEFLGTRCAQPVKRESYIECPSFVSQVSTFSIKLRGKLNQRKFKKVEHIWSTGFDLLVKCYISLIHRAFGHCEGSCSSMCLFPGENTHVSYPCPYFWAESNTWCFFVHQKGTPTR